MGIWSDRLWLATKGWSTNLTIGENGLLPSRKDRRHVGLWARTPVWHGRPFAITVHSHAIVAADQPHCGRVLDAMSARLREACGRAHRDYADVVPCQVSGLDGTRIRLAASPLVTRRFLSQPASEAPVAGLVTHGKIRDRGLFGQQVERLIFACPDAVYEINDNLAPHGEEGRVTWSYEVDPVMREYRGQRLRYEHRKGLSLALGEKNVASFLEASVLGFLDDFAAHAPGGASHDGTGSELPPGYSPFRPFPDQAIDLNPSISLSA
ncbi:hypothetical protein ACEUZ9_004128 [Paracoccus litorisediminis]|uniref:hypothetical protein n=1 Tax=Paracoccus litorisediminis TaxID=2006130 RepID=UPI00372EB7A6